MITVDEASSLIRIVRNYLSKKVNIEESLSQYVNIYVKKTLSEEIQHADELSWTGIYIIVKMINNSPHQTIRLRVGFPIIKMSIEDAVKLLSHNAYIRLSRLYNSLSPKDFVIELMMLHEFRKINNIKPVNYPKLIDVSKNGVLILRNFYLGVSLPIETANNNLDAIDLLTDCCLSAGLPPDAWLDVNTDVYVFNVTKFKEISTEGNIHRGSVE